jgi:membrane protein implicated in regulation of membrane protease activity
VKSGVYALIGKEGITVEEIQDGGSGTVKVGGEIWRATSEEKLIPKGTAIEVVDVEGVTLKVKSLGG